MLRLSSIVRGFTAALLIIPALHTAPEAGPAQGLQELRALVVNSSGRPAASELERLESKYSRTRTAALARFLRGYLYYSAQNYAAAIDALDISRIEATSSLGDYAAFYLAESESSVGAERSALRHYAVVNESYPHSVLARESLLKGARAAIDVGDPDSALRSLAPMIKSKDAEGLYLAGVAYEKKGDTPAAVQHYRTVYFERPASPVGEPAASRLEAVGFSPRENPGSYDEMVTRADAFFDSKQYDEAARAYDELLSRFSATTPSGQVILRHGISLLNSRQTEEALVVLARVGDGNQAEAWFHQAEAYRRNNSLGNAATTVDLLRAKHKQSRWAANALYNLAAQLERQGRLSEASVRYRQLWTEFPDSEFAPEASYNLGWSAYIGKRLQEAARILESHLTAYRSPQSKFIGEAGFWAAKAHERLGNRTRALALYDAVAERYRYGYHGHVAALRAAAIRAANPGIKLETARPGSDLAQIKQNVLHFDKVVETDDGSQSGRTSRADDLELIGLDELAVREMNHALAAAPNSPRLSLRLAQIYSRRGENFQATLVLRRAYPDLFSYADSDLPREAWEILFPLTHWKLIKDECKRYAIDPYVVAGLIRQESVFNPTAISRVGARGLMQLMPSTARHIARSQGIGQVTAADLYNPVLNIKLGMYYLSQRLGDFGRIEYAAAAYNAGPGRVRQWLAARRDMDIEEWIEHIPFSETRGYVQGVLRNAANYRRLYED